jgi:SAM-dependent methyltransferase
MSSEIARNFGAGHLSNAYGQFAYFDAQLGHPDWVRKLVLDFGGNQGNLLDHPGCPIDERNYWCVDISSNALRAGQRRHPDAHWIFYDRYSFQYNPTGTVGLPIPELHQTFDLILAYSVFTHLSKGEMLDLVEQLQSRLRAGGRLAFTFLDPHFERDSLGGYWPVDGDVPRASSRQREVGPGANLEWRLRRREDLGSCLDIDALSDRGKGARWCTLANDELYVEQDGPAAPAAIPDNVYEVFYTPDFVASLFPGAEIRPPVKPSRHHCCIIGKDQSS